MPPQQIRADLPARKRLVSRRLFTLHVRAPEDGHDSFAKPRIGTLFGQYAFALFLWRHLCEMKQFLQLFPVLRILFHWFTLLVGAKQRQSASSRVKSVI